MYLHVLGWEKHIARPCVVSRTLTVFVMPALLALVWLPSSMASAVSGERDGDAARPTAERKPASVGLAAAQPPPPDKGSSRNGKEKPPELRADPPDPQIALGQDWEDLLLLEAIRYLHLAPWQLQRMLPLCRTAEERRNDVVQHTARTRAKLGRIARKQRDLLLKGRDVSLQEQTDALLLWQSLRRKQVQAEEEIVARVASRLIRVFTREQVQHAYLLALGEVPQPWKEARRVALLDTSSGFVLDEQTRAEWRVVAIERALSRRYPAGLVASLVQQIRRVEGTRTVSLVQVNGADRPLPYLLNTDFPQELNVEAMQEMDALATRWNDLATLLVEGATDEELALALRPLAWRLFLSPNFKPLVSARLNGANVMSAPEPDDGSGD